MRRFAIFFVGFIVGLATAVLAGTSGVVDFQNVATWGQSAQRAVVVTLWPDGRKAMQTSLALNSTTQIVSEYPSALASLHTVSEDAQPRRWAQVINNLESNAFSAPVATTSLTPQADENRSVEIAAQSHVPVADQSTDHVGGAGRSGDQEVAEVEFVREQLRQENEALRVAIASVDKDHPQHHYLTTTVLSNLAFDEILALVISMGRDEFAVEDLLSLQETLDQSRKDIEERISMGRSAQKNLTIIVGLLPATNDQDRALKQQSLAILATYDDSFAIEQQITEHMQVFPGAIVSLLTGANEAAFNQWFDGLSVLANLRVATQDERVALADGMQVSAVTNDDQDKHQPG